MNLDQFREAVKLKDELVKARHVRNMLAWPDTVVTLTVAPMAGDWQQVPVTADVVNRAKVDIDHTIIDLENKLRELGIET